MPGKINKEIELTKENIGENVEFGKTGNQAIALSNSVSPVNNVSVQVPSIALHPSSGLFALLCSIPTLPQSTFIHTGSVSLGLHPKPGDNIRRKK